MVSELDGVRPELILGFDEKGIIAGAAVRQVCIVRCGDSAVSLKGVCDRIHLVAELTRYPDDAREMVTVIECICADGTSIDPFFIFKSAGEPPRVNASWVCNDGPAEARYAASSTGWSDNELGVEWIQYFDQATSPKALLGTRHLVFDGHGSHLSYNFIKYAFDNTIKLICLPPHATHILQGLDVVIFGPLQRAYSSVVEQRCPAACNVRKSDVSKLVAILFILCHPSNIDTGFISQLVSRSLPVPI